MEQEKSYSQKRKEFQDKFFKEIKPLLADYEKEHSKIFDVVIKSSIKYGLIFSFVLAIIYLIIQICNAESLKIFFNNEALFNFLTDIIQLSIICIVSLLVLFKHIAKKLVESTMKKQFMSQICEIIGDIKWTPKNNLIDLILQGYINNNLDSVINNNARFDIDPDNLLRKSNLIPDYDITIPDDIFEGTHNKVAYSIIETKLCRYVGERKDKKYAQRFAALGFTHNVTTLFSGIIVKLDMNKNFKGNTIIVPDLITHKSPNPKLKHTVLEDVIFEKKFDVFTDDEVEARYLITPSFMERLNHIKLAFSADKISCAFFDKHLFLALQTNKDIFSLGNLNKSLEDSEQFFIMFEEILSIIQLIDHFKLAQKTGL